MSLDPGLLAVLACPACKGPLTLVGSERLSCPACKKNYPVEDGVANLIVS